MGGFRAGNTGTGNGGGATKLTKATLNQYDLRSCIRGEVFCRKAISYAVLKLATGQANKVSVGVYVLSIVFIAKFIYM